MIPYTYPPLAQLVRASSLYLEGPWFESKGADQYGIFPDMKKKKDIDTKIDELAQMVARGFSETHEDISRVEVRVGHIEARVERIEEDSLIKADLIRLRGDIDIMLDKHVGTFRKDYDELAMRVKKLERRVFAH